MRKGSRRFPPQSTAKVPDVSHLGPHMLALTEKQRRFVLELANGPSGWGSAARAARAAGYGTEKSSNHKMASEGHRLLQNERVQAALQEVGKKILTADVFDYIRQIKTIAADVNHKDALRANIELLNRSGFQLEQVVHVHKSGTPESLTIVTNETLERIRLLAARAGIDPVEQVTLAGNRIEDQSE